MLTHLRLCHAVCACRKGDSACMLACMDIDSSRASCAWMLGVPADPELGILIGSSDPMTCIQHRLLHITPSLCRPLACTSQSIVLGRVQCQPSDQLQHILSKVRGIRQKPYRAYCSSPAAQHRYDNRGLALFSFPRHSPMTPFIFHTGKSAAQQHNKCTAGALTMELLHPCLGNEL